MFAAKYFIPACIAAALCFPVTAPAAGGNAAPPFAFMNGGWQAAGVIFLPPPSGPGPVVDMPGRKRIGNNLALGQPIFAMADLNNPILHTNEHSKQGRFQLFSRRVDM